MKQALSRTIYAIIDVVLVVVFAILGRATHHEAITLIGVWQTSMPFIIGLAVGWVFVGFTTNRPERLWPEAAMIWVNTVAVGMVLRLLLGDTAMPTFILIAAGVLAVLLALPRVAAILIAQRKQQRPAATEAEAQDAAVADAGSAGVSG